MGPPDRERFTILTTRPNQVVARVHDRMPVVISPSRIDLWLSGQASEVIDLIAPAPEQTLLAKPVSRRVNAVKNDDPACLAPLTNEVHSTREATKRQLTLF
jgi:putative SOS response-associated peptidase YedK